MKKPYFKVLLIINLFAMGIVLYLVGCYLYRHEDQLRAENVIGAIYIAFYSFPLWLSLAFSGVLRRKNITTKELILTFIPVTFMVSTLVITYLVAFNGFN